MKQQRQEEIEYDVYFRGTNEELYAFMYPLTGPNSSLFDHLEMKTTSFDVEKKAFQMRYEAKDFENIDKQKEDIVYKSTLMPTQSNYFYSIFQPENNCFVWQRVDNFVEMRPTTKGIANINEQEKEKEEQKNKIELEVISADNPDNKAMQILLTDTVSAPLKENWQVSKDEYLMHLAK